MPAGRIAVQASGTALEIAQGVFVAGLPEALGNPDYECC
jgi:hypothetical protein